MAIGRMSMKVGKAGKAGPHAAYIAREGQYANRLERGERLEATESGNMPNWAKDQPQAFWLAADALERSNGTTYREMEIALPRELNSAQQVELVREWVEKEIGDRHAYQWAIHVPMAADGAEQPHVHLMFSERQVDGIERDPEQYFKRYNAKAPEKGGARKGYGEHAGQTLSRAERARDLKELRSRWADACNGALERAGSAERIDMRSHAERGTGIEPERKQLPSEWRDPMQRAQVIEFRAARRELTTATRELARAVPDVRGELINLDRERERRRTVETPREETPPLTGSAAIRAQIEKLKGESAPSDGPAVLGMRERFAALMDQLESGKPAVQPEPPPAVVSAVPEPVHQVQRVERLPGESGLDALIRKMKQDADEAAKKPGFSLQQASPETAKPEPKAVHAIEPVHEVTPVAKLPSANQVELEALKAGLVPVAELVAADPKVIEAKKDLARHLAREAEAKSQQVEIPKQVAEWRAEHPWQAALHDKGVKKSSELERAEQAMARAQLTLKNASGAQRMYEEDLSRAERRASDPIYMERRPLLSRIEALEAAVRLEMAPEPLEQEKAPRVGSPGRRWSSLGGLDDADRGPEASDDYGMDF